MKMDMYIARFRTKDLEQQTLREHIMNTAQIGERLGEKVYLKNTLKLIGLLHDMGKYSEQFQNFINNELQKAKKDKKKYLLEKNQSNFDHGVYGAKYIYSDYKGGGIKEKAIREILALVIAYHHGGLPDCENENGEIPLLTRLIKEQLLRDYDVVVQRFNNEIKVDLKQLFKKSYEEMSSLVFGDKMRQASDKQFMPNLVIKLIYSMLIDADRLDSMCFEENKKVDVYMRQDDIVNIWNKYQTNFEDYIFQLKNNGIKNSGCRDIHYVRNEISEECRKKADCQSGIYKLTVPTGGGKTLASMRFAIQHNKLKKKERIIYVIPYTSIIEQNAEVVRKALNYECDLLEHHSNVIEDHKVEEYKLLSERWNNDIVFTTMVQFLNTFYYKGTRDMRRLHNLMNSTIIFDEVQMVPTKSISLFNSAINFLNRVGNSTIILCTATQPKLDTINLPIKIDDMDHELISDIGQKFQQMKRVEIVDCCNKIQYQMEMAVDFILEKKTQVRSLLVVVNKISTAEQIFNELQNRAETQVIFLSSHLCPQHRKNVLNKLYELLENGQDLICVSTSLIEAGIDISFEAAIRNISKLDSIAQTAGRVNRNGETRMGYCYVINLDEGSYGRMKEIQIGQINTRKVFLDSSMQKILNPEIMEKYFQQYFTDKTIQSDLLYPMKKAGVTKEIYRLLETSKKNVSGINKGKINFKIMFRTAAKNFQAIEQDMKTVIVPYEDGMIIMDKIERMDVYTTISEKKAVLEQAKKYCVNINKYMFETLKKRNAVVENEVTGTYLLGSGYYSLEKGVTINEDIEMFMQ